MANRIQNFNTTASDLRAAKFPEAFIKDYSLIAKNFAILSTQFQWIKDGDQFTTGSYEALTGWTVERNTGDFSVDSSAGEITFNLTGDYSVDCFVLGDGNGGLYLQLQHYYESSWHDVSGALAIDDQNPIINGLLISVSNSDKIRLRIKDAADAMNITDKGSRISIGRRS